MHISISAETAAELAAIAEQTGQTQDELIAEMLTEAVKMRRVPGILFADGATGRRARVGGTGIEVFEVIDLYEATGHSVEHVQELLPQLGMHQIMWAIQFYEAFPDEVRARLFTDEEDRAALEALWRKHPQTSPHWPGQVRSAGATTRVPESA